MAMDMDTGMGMDMDMVMATPPVVKKMVITSKERMTRDSRIFGQSPSGSNDRDPKKINRRLKV
jgi:hypothetical protein